MNRREFFGTAAVGISGAAVAVALPTFGSAAVSGDVDDIKVIEIIDGRITRILNDPLDVYGAACQGFPIVAVRNPDIDRQTICGVQVAEIIRRNGGRGPGGTWKPISPFTPV